MKRKRYIVNAYSKGTHRDYLECDNFKHVIYFVSRKFHYYSNTVFWIDDRKFGRRKLPRQTVEDWYKEYWVLVRKEIDKDQLIRYNIARRPILDYYNELRTQ